MFDKLKKLFVVDEGTASQGNPQVETSEKEEVGTPTSSSPAISVNPNAEEGTPDQKFIDILLKAIESNNMEGFDYLEYKQSLQSLAAMPMDDSTRYNSALAMAKTMGATKESLVSSANHYMQILKAEEGKFKNALGAQQSKIEQNSTTGISNLEKSIVQKQAQVESMLKQIEEDKTRLEQMKEEISSSTNKIQTTANNFMSAYNLVVGQIKNDVDNIQNFVK